MMNDERQVNQKADEAKKEEKHLLSSLDGVVLTPCGSAIMPVYKRVYDKKRDANIVHKTDVFNLDEYIQSSKSQTDLATLQKRFLELGEIPAVDPSMGSNDLSVLPSDIHGVYAMANDVASNFNKLPAEVQKVFGDKDAYLKAILNGSVNSILINAFAAKKSEETPKQEEKQEEKKGDLK